MDTSKLPKIRDEERESEFGYVHGVSGPGQLSSSHVMIYVMSICSTVFLYASYNMLFR